eukprot:CAMPEP_0197715634 /NCGR_PEP_ID=MMETSP1434-20131217/756_1 /TAXON_ID=265543 /ORGANISM="Minutocellus polymorphus, Strain CCMP3303" /LENGTH=73 /DNA_ID=CAMNT_0043299811 /DNA_START=369 /DNA_END=586 /DNA_ORIENTATION=+
MATSRPFLPGPASLLEMGNVGNQKRFALEVPCVDFDPKTAEHSIDPVTIPLETAQKRLGKQKQRTKQKLSHQT